MSRTKQEEERRQKIYELGCIACRIDGKGYVPCSEHHLKDGSCYRDNMKTFGICLAHHQIEFAVPGVPNRHKNAKEFAEVYGTDQELLEYTNRIIGDGCSD